MLRWMWILTLGAALFSASTLHAEEGDGGRDGRRGLQGRRGGLLKKMQEKRQERLSEVPGAAEELERHKAANQAIHEKLKLLKEDMKEILHNAPSAEDRDAAMKTIEADIRTLAGQAIDERLNHATRMLELQKAHRDEAVEKLTQKLMEVSNKRMDRAEKVRGHRGGGGDMPSPAHDESSGGEELSETVDDIL